MTLAPAPADQGIWFQRTDVEPAIAWVPARHDRVCDVTLCTTIANQDGVRVATVEHLMAAIAGLGIDNLTIQIDGPEVAVMDGSAAPFAYLLGCAGMVAQDAPRRRIRIKREVGVEAGGASARLSPAAAFGISVAIEFDNPVVANQAVTLAPLNGAFVDDLAPARTFGFADEVAKLRSVGLARGGSLENAVVISGDAVLNEEGLRFPDEFVRHKALDALGDLSLAGAPILGHFHGHCSGHALNNALLKTLFANAEAWEWALPDAAQIYDAAD